jgi:carboxyl-terminal processing protease
MGRATKNQRGLGYSLLIGVFIGLGAALTFVAGFFFRDAVHLAFPTAFAASSTRDSYPLLGEVQMLLDQHYLREQPDISKRQHAAIRGVMAILEDRYTFFIDPPVAQSESDTLAGTYGGIGVQLNRNEAGQFVLFPFADSPAAAAGIENSAVLKAVNGMSIDLTIQQDAVDQMLRGEVKDGNGVEITVQNPDSPDDLTVFIEFAVINVPSVIWRVLDEDEAIGYVQIVRFTSRTPEELATGLTELKEAGVSALVVDLRNNSGGLLQESVDVTSQFIAANEVIVYEQSNNSENVLRAAEGGLATELPLVVLVNQGTASASELVAAAIQDHDRGILIGQRTFGKGTVQQIFRLSDNSSVHITSAQWLTPDHRQLENVGLEPDIAMIPDVNGRDVELGEAIRYLRQHHDLR